jgi:Fe-S cluster assembly protein SufD
MTDSAVNYYVEEFRRFQTCLTRDYLADNRHAALELFRKNGFPTQRMENWKYTDVRPITRKAFLTLDRTNEKINSELLGKGRLLDIESHELVFIDGVYSQRFSKIKSLPGATVVQNIAEVNSSQNNIVSEHITKYADPGLNSFTALNTAFMNHGALIHVPANVVVKIPFNIIYLSTSNNRPTAIYPRNLIIMGENAGATVIENYIGPDDADYFTNAVTEICMYAGSRLQHYKIQQESLKSYHIGNLHVRHDENSHVESYSISLGGSLVRNDIHSQLHAAGAGVVLNGLYLANGHQHMDNHTRIDHQAPFTTSRENYRGVLNDNARGVFNGKVVVHRDAQKTDAMQSNANLLLSDNAEVDTKPELEIYADDVKCAHGATVGQFDKDMMFYLRSRALDEVTARNLLTYAFIDEVIRHVEPTSLRRHLEQSIINRMPNASIVRKFTV